MPDLDEELAQLQKMLSATAVEPRDVSDSDPIHTLPEFLDSYGVYFPSLDKTHMIPDGIPLTPAEIESIRILHESGELPEILALDFNVTEQDVEDIVDGKIGPYAGGLIRQPKTRSGCDPRMFAKYTNDRFFVSGVLSLAKQILTRPQFEVFVNFNGLDPKSLQRLEAIKNNERRPDTYQRYRDFLGSHTRTAQKKRPGVRVYRRKFSRGK